MIPHKIDLEKKMTEEMENPFSKEQLKKVREFKENISVDEDKTLEKLGLDKHLKNGKYLKNRQDELKNETKDFNQDKVFHISQIKNIARKYHLKFLPVEYYNGNIDDELPQKIRNFEIAYGVKVSQPTSYIMAPAPNFDLQEPQRPIDPLFFHRINSEYFYLIHKWGDDITNYRRLLSIASTNTFTWSFIFAVIALLSYISFNMVIELGIIMTIISVIGSIVFMAINFDPDNDNGPFTFVEKITANKYEVDQKFTNIIGDRPRGVPQTFDVDTPKRFNNPSFIYA